MCIFVKIFVPNKLLFCSKLGKYRTEKWNKLMMKKYNSVDRFYKLHELFSTNFQKSEQNSQVLEEESNEWD